MTTCTSGLISWGYSGKAVDLSLSIDNIGMTVNATIQQQLVDTNTSALSWTWPSVNLTQGWYEIQGLVHSSPTVSNKSAPFFISNGSDTTCLTSLSTVSNAAEASDTNVASIVGGVVGGVVGVTLAFIAGVYLWLRRRKRSFVGGGGSRDRKWGSLKSTSSSTPPEDSGGQPANNNFHAHSESMGAILHDVVGGKVSGTSTPGGSDEDVIVVSEEKLVSPASSSGMSPFDALNTPLHHDRRVSMYSTQTPAAAISESFRSHAPSAYPSTQGLEQQAQRIRSSMETSVRRRSDRLSMPTLPSPALSRSTTRTQEEYPLGPVSPTPVNRSISTGAISMTARRSARKPVPQYDSILLEGKNADSASSFTGGAGSSQSHGTGLGAGAYGTPSGLVHKASFGDGRPVHYLIPDMPPPQRD